MSRVAFVLAEDFEDSEFRRPYDEVRAAGHKTTVIGKDADARVGGKRGEETAVTEVAASEVSSEDFSALVIPGGYAPDKLRLDPHTVRFVQAMVESGKPVAAICHAAQLLIEADVVEGYTLTSWPSVRKDVENAGGLWVDRQVVEDGNLITSRKPEDLDAFCTALLRQLERTSGA